jgi:hypothetical protein
LRKPVGDQIRQGIFAMLHLYIQIERRRRLLVLLSFPLRFAPGANVTSL